MPKFHRKYVDDIYMIFKHKDHINQFLDFMNKKYTNIKFTVENELNDELPFFDVLVKRTNDLYNTSQYFKNTELNCICLLYTSPSPRDGLLSRMPSSA